MDAKKRDYLKMNIVEALSLSARELRARQKDLKDYVEGKGLLFAKTQMRSINTCSEHLRLIIRMLTGEA